MSVQELLEDALARKRDGLLRRWSHYECFKTVKGDEDE